MYNFMLKVGKNNVNFSNHQITRKINQNFHDLGFDAKNWLDLIPVEN